MRDKLIKEPSAEIIDLIKRSGDLDERIALAAQYELAKALVTPLRQAVLVGDVATQIFEKRQMPYGVPVEFPVDILTPGEESQFVAYTNPGNGRIAEKSIEGDYVTVPTYGITSAIDWLLRHAREARYDIVGRCMQILEASFVKKINDDGWHTLLSAGMDRNILVFDADASTGQFTKRLVSLMKVIMQRNAGGNTASLKRGRLTDIFMSPEGVEDIRNWGLDLIDDVTRREIYTAADDGITGVFGVKLHNLVEFGENQEYQQFFTANLGGSLNGGDLELVVGMDLNSSDAFLMPWKQDVQIYPDPGLHRQQRAGVYGWAEIGFAVLDNRRVICGSF